MVGIESKNDFLAYSERFFIYILSYRTSYASSFSQNKGLMKLHNRGKFHKYTICGCQVINFQRFSNRFNIHDMAGVFCFVLFLRGWGEKWVASLGYFLPQIRFDFSAIYSRGLNILDKHSVGRSFPNFESFLKREIPKLYSFGPFLGPI